MRERTTFWGIGGLALVGFGIGVWGAAPPAKAPLRLQKPLIYSDQVFLTERKIGIEAGGLARWLESKVGSDTDLANVGKLVELLGSDDFATRKEATEKLKRLGFAAMQALRAARDSKDAEVRQRVEECIRALEKSGRMTLDESVVRVASEHKVEGMVRSLLRFLPYAAGDSIKEMIYFRVDNIVKERGAPGKSLVEAIDDRIPERRALAGCIVGRWGNQAQRRKVQRLLQDADAGVQLRAAQGLVAGGDPAGIPTLIDLLSAPDIGIAWQAEELLNWAACYPGRRTAIGWGEKAARESAKREWGKWWLEQSARWKRETAKRWHRMPGLTGMRGVSRDENKVWVCGGNGAKRWLLVTGEKEIRTVHWLGHGKVLVGEEPRNEVGSHVFERDRIGKILWAKRWGGSGLIKCYRSATDRIVAIYPKTIREWSRGGELTEKSVEDITALAEISWSTCRQVANGHYVWGGVGGVVDFDPLSRKSRVVKWEGRGEADYLQLGKGNVLSVDSSKDLVEEYAGTRQGNNQHEAVVWKRTLQSVRRPLWEMPNGHSVVLCRWVAGRMVDISENGLPVGQVPVGTLEPIAPFFLLLGVGFGRAEARDLDTEAVQDILETLRRGEVDERRAAADQLTILTGAAGKRVAELIALLADSDTETRRKIQLTIRRNRENSFPHLIKGLQHPNGTVRCECAMALGDLARAVGIATPALANLRQVTVPALIKLLKDPDEKVRERASWTLGLYGTEAKEAVMPLIAAFKDRTSTSRARAAIADALGDIGPSSQPAIPLLLAAANSDNEVAERALLAIGRIGYANPLIIQAMNDKLRITVNQRLQLASAAALGQLGAYSVGAVPNLSRLLRYGIKQPKTINDNLLITIVTALGKIGGGARSALPVLGECASNKQMTSTVRVTAIEAIETIGESTISIRHVLAQLVQDSDMTIRRAAVRTLKSLQRE